MFRREGEMLQTKGMNAKGTEIHAEHEKTSPVVLEGPGELCSQITKTCD